MIRFVSRQSSPPYTGSREGPSDYPRTKEGLLPKLLELEEFLFVLVIIKRVRQFTSPPPSKRVLGHTILIVSSLRAICRIELSSSKSCTMTISRGTFLTVRSIDGEDLSSASDPDDLVHRQMDLLYPRKL